MHDLTAVLQHIHIFIASDKAVLCIHLTPQPSHLACDEKLVSGLLMQGEVCLIGSAGVLLGTTTNGLH